MKILIVDDEPLARRHLRRHLETLEAFVAGEAEDAPSALILIDELKPDVLFLDVQMPGMTGIQLANALQSLDKTPLFVYVTGYAEFALTAFEQNAVDYLLKPINPVRLLKTVLRLRELIAADQPPSPPAELANSASRSSQPSQPSQQRLAIKENFSIRFVPIQEIAYAFAKEKRVFVCTPKEEFKTTYTLTQLESLLPSEGFFRIHDSCIVQLALIVELHLLGSHSYVVRLSGGTQLPVSRLRYVELQKRLGLE